MESKLGKLTINRVGKSNSGKRPEKSTEVADSWEEDSGSSTEGADDTGTTTKGMSIPDPPPPTPISPRGNFPNWNALDAEVKGGCSPRGHGSPSGRDDGRRQEKSTAVASRLIAAGLGVKAPKRTEEQRAYDRVTKENETRKKNREKEVAAKDKEADDKAKAAVWG